MSDTFTLSDLIDNKSEWPKCPKCGDRATLSGGLLACCINCGFMGSYLELQQTQLFGYARAKMSSRHMGHRGVLAMFPKTEDAEFFKIVTERASHLSQRLVHAPIFHKAGLHLLKNREFNPVAVYNYRPEDHHPITLPMSEGEKERTLLKVQSADVASVIWHGKFVRDFSESDRDTPSHPDCSALVINTHFYNAPSHARAIGIDWKDGKPLLSPHPFPEVNGIQPHPLIWQPIYWPIVSFIPGRIQPRYFAALEIEDDVNLNFSVCEDMDGAPLVRAAARKPGDIGKPTIKTYACDDAESGVALLKEKFANAVEQSSGGDTGRLLFKQELEWGTEEHPWMISYQLRNAELWEHYQKIRK